MITAFYSTSGFASGRHWVFGGKGAITPNNCCILCLFSFYPDFRKRIVHVQLFKLFEAFAGHCFHPMPFSRFYKGNKSLINFPSSTINCFLTPLFGDSKSIFWSLREAALWISWERLSTMSSQMLMAFRLYYLWYHCNHPPTCPVKVLIKKMYAFRCNIIAGGRNIKFLLFYYFWNECKVILGNYI